jgi:DNA invertase Pin-like site-specific DNA recombinase
MNRVVIAERVRAGVRNARAKGKRLGRPALKIDGGKVRELREAGKSFEEIGSALGVSAASAWRAAQA